MEFDFSWLLWGLPLAFACGWLASRFDLRQWRLEGRQAPKAYFRGLNHLLNEQQDEAIDAFIEAVQHDPDTSELHFALGNLFRRRGDYDRAVRVHEHLMSRGDLAAKDRHRAQHALAHDFIKAGLLDRAEAALLKLEGSPFEAEARLALLAIYERTRDWAKAADTAEQLQTRGEGNFQQRLAHYRCELAEQEQRDGHTTQALATLEALVVQVSDSPRAWIALADMRQSVGNTAGALQALEALFQHTPQHLPLVAHILTQWARLCQTPERATRLLQAYRQAHLPSLDVTHALAHLQDSPAEGQALYLEHLEKEPSLVAAAHWLAGEHFGEQAPQQRVRQAIDRAAEPLKRYRCAACGFEARQYFWHCPGCQGWDTYPPKRIEEL